MEITQTYETTIMDVRGKIGFSAFVIPARSSALHTDQEAFDSGMVRTVAELLGAEVLQNGPRYPSQIHDQIYSILYGQYKDTANVFELSMYVAFSPIIPFENSPLSAESLASIATSSVK